MKKFKNKDISISDLVNEFHVSKAAIELYGVHRLIQPISGKTTRSIYRPLDKARLKFIARAKEADYTIGDIKDLIGVLDLEKDEIDQIEESLVYCKNKSAALTKTLEDLDALEQINVTCDIELLEAYKTDLNNLKYGLDIAPITTAAPDPIAETSSAKPRTLVYSHLDDQVKTATPAIVPKKSRRSLVVVAGIFLLAISGYLYLGGDLLPDMSNNLVATPKVDPVEMTTETATSNQTDEINLSESDTNTDGSVDTLTNKRASTKAPILLNDFPILKNELTSPSTDPMASMPETYSDKQIQDTKNTQALLDVINESREKTPKPGTPEKERTEDVFLKQLFADMQKKYDQQAQIQKPTTNDTSGRNAAPEEMSETKEAQDLTPVDIPNDASQTDKTMPTTTKTSPIITTTTPEKAAPLVVSRAPASLNTDTPSTNTLAPPQPVPSPKPSSPVIRPKSSTEQPTASTKKAETSILSKRDESASKVITPPKPKPLPEPEPKPDPKPKPKPEPKPKAIPQKPANPEALKWTQKSYESVMADDAGQAIIAASVAITLDPNLVNAYINRSWAYSKKGLYDRAIQDCDKALDIDNDNALAYNNRGLAFQGKGDMDKAKADYERACKLGFDIGCKNYREVVESKLAE